MKPTTLLIAGCLVGVLALSACSDDSSSAHEASTSLTFKQLERVLQFVVDHFGDPNDAIPPMIASVRTMDQGEEHTWTIDILPSGQPDTLQVDVFVDDTDVYEVGFFGSAVPIRAIDTAMRAQVSAEESHQGGT